MQYSKEPSLDIINNCEQKAVEMSIKAHFTIIATDVLMGRDILSLRCLSCRRMRVSPEAA